MNASTVPFVSIISPREKSEYMQMKNFVMCFQYCSQYKFGRSPVQFPCSSVEEQVSL